MYIKIVFLLLYFLIFSHEFSVAKSFELFHHSDSFFHCKASVLIVTDVSTYLLNAISIVFIIPVF